MSNLIKKILLIFIVFIATYSSYSQNIEKIDSLNKLIENSEQNKLADLYIKLSKVYSFVLFQTSEKYAKKAIYYAKLNNDSVNLIYAYRVVGAVKKYQNHLDSAIYYFTLAKQVAKNANLNIEEAISSSNIALVFANKLEFDKALSVYMEALVVIEASNNLQYVAQIYNNIGLIYTYKKDYKNALLYYNKALSIKKEKNDFSSYAISLSNIAEVYYLQNQIDSAIVNYNKAIEIFTQYDNKYNISFTSINIAELYLSEADYEKAYLYINQALSYAKEIKNKDLEKTCYKYLSQISKKKHDYKLALKYHELYKNISDTIIQNQNNKLLTDLKVKFEFEKKEKSLLLQKEKINQQQNLLFIFIIGFAIVLFLLIYVILQKRKLLFAGKNLVKQNINILTVENELAKYKKNTSASLKTNLIDKILNLVENEKVYLDTELTIFKFADILKINKSYISQEINTRFKKNFNQFINDYRVAEAKRLMILPENEKLTIAAISQKSGFKSVTAFNRAFKNITGVTPSFFLNSVKQNNR